MVCFDAERSAAENAAEMAEAAAAVRAGRVARASRTTTLGGLEIEEGEFLGLVDGEPVATGPVLDAVAREVVERLLGEGRDVLTILAGEEAPAVDELVAAAPRGAPGARGRGARGRPAALPPSLLGRISRYLSGEGAPIKLLLVEDNDIFREALELLLDVHAPDVEVVAAVPDGRSALEACAGTEPDVVLMDYRLPELDGVETTARDPRHAAGRRRSSCSRRSRKRRDRGALRGRRGRLSEEGLRARDAHLHAPPCRRER